MKRLINYWTELFEIKIPENEELYEDWHELVDEFKLLVDYFIYEKYDGTVIEHIVHINQHEDGNRWYLMWDRKNMTVYGRLRENSKVTIRPISG